MAAAPLPPPSPTGPPAGAPPVAGSAPQGGPALLKLVAFITDASRQMAQIFPASSPEVEEIQNQLQLVQQKMVATASPQMPAAPPV
jgi:hypothetical protein